MSHPFSNVTHLIVQQMRIDKCLDALDHAAEAMWQARQKFDEANREAVGLGLTKTDHWSIR